jgi:hypothetical protein
VTECKICLLDVSRTQPRRWVRAWHKRLQVNITGICHDDCVVDVELGDPRV